MESVTNLQGVQDPQGWFVGNLEGTADGGSFGVAVESICYDDRQTGVLLAFSGLCGPTELKSIRGQLTSGRACRLIFEEFQGAGHYDRTHHLKRSDEGYRVLHKAVSRHQYHVVALARDKEFLPDGSEESVWQYLVSHTTTPAAREWVPKLTARFEEDGHLYYPTAHGGIRPAVIRLGDRELDPMISGMVKRNVLEIL